MIAGALMNGIPVIASKDACDPRTFRKEAPGAGRESEVFARKIDGYAKMLEGFGIRLVPAADLSRAGRMALTAGSEGSREPVKTALKRQPGNRPET